MSSSTDQSPRLRVRTQSTGLYLFRYRNYSPSLGTWISQDPAGYINGANTYQFVMSNPVGNVDPSGLWVWWNPFTWPIWSSAPAQAVPYVVPGSEVLEGAAALSNLPKAAGLANLREQTDMCNNVNPQKDPLYTGLRKLSNGQPLTPQEHQAVLNAMK